MKSDSHRDHQQLSTEDLLGIVCRFAPEHAVEEGVYDFGGHKHRPDAAVNESFAYALVREVEQTFEPDQHPVVKLLSLAGYYARLSQDLDRLVKGLTEYARCWTLREFWEWFAQQQRPGFTWGLFHSWVAVHEVAEVRAAGADLQRELQRLVPELAGIEDKDFAVDRAWWKLTMDKLRSELRRCGAAVAPVVQEPPPPAPQESPAAEPASNPSEPAKTTTTPQEGTAVQQ